MSDDSEASHIAKLYSDFYAVVRRIPEGRVLTYGQLAELAGRPGAARAAGAALRCLPAGLGLPWQRVIGKKSRGQGRVSIHDPIGGAIQRQLLEEEGVCFSESGGVRLEDFGWIPE
ncbi:MAG: cysteine methyltransferase [Myxococcales bacterium]|nr:cysteine methyltransferase [Myxococcales bacterium]